MKPRWKNIEEENLWLETEFHDIIESPEVVEKYDISDIPLFIFLDKEDKEILRLTGEVEKEDLIKIIEENKDK